MVNGVNVIMGRGPQMIDIQILGGVLMALAVLVGASIAISLAIMATGSVTQTGQTPPGGIRRDPPRQTPPGGIRRDPPRQPHPDTDDARELVLR
jgi:hypothetical protein